MKWEKLKSEYIYKTPFGNLRKDQCKLPDGKIVDEYYVNEYDDWVNAIVITKNNELVLVEQYRHAAGGIYLEIPAGKIEKNESYEEGILRELREETGYTSDKQPIILGNFMVNPATQTNKIITFLILDAYKAYEQNLDPSEFINVHTIDFNMFEYLIDNNEVNTQLFTATAYYMAKNYFLTI